MKKLNELIHLEKHSNIDISVCERVADAERDGSLTRIYKHGERYFFHQTKGTEVTCFEIAVDWRPFQDVLIFAYTPDDLHICQIDQRIPNSITVLRLREDQIQPGMCCTYDGYTVQYVDEDRILFHGVEIPVIKDGKYVYKLLKRGIRASGGARGLYCVLENIAETGKYEYPLFASTYKMIAKKYLISK